MAEVWRAEHVSTGRQFAIKLMHEYAAEDQDSRERFTREAKLSSRIHHPGIVDVIDVGQLDNGVPYLVIELLDGVSLGEVLDSDPPISIRDLLAILAQTARAIAAAHDQGVVHRDLKPANIFMHFDSTTGFHRAKVVDFGVGKMSLPDDTFDTATNDVLGSPRYMSPEQAASAAGADHRTDIWALGVVLFVALTGQWPHEGDHYGSLVMSITSHPPKRIGELAPDLPAPLRDLVTRMLAPRDERLGSASELAETLDSVLATHDLSNRPAKWVARGKGTARGRLRRALQLATRSPERLDDADTDADTLVDDPLAGEAATTKMRAPAKPADVAWNPVNLQKRTEVDSLSGRLVDLAPRHEDDDMPTLREFDEEEDIATIERRRRPPPVPPLPTRQEASAPLSLRDPRIIALWVVAALVGFGVAAALVLG